MRHIHSYGNIRGVHINNICTLVTHSQFADDTLLTTYPSIQEIHAIKNLLNTFEITPGQEVNYHK